MKVEKILNYCDVCEEGVTFESVRGYTSQLGKRNVLVPLKIGGRVLYNKGKV